MDNWEIINRIIGYFLAKNEKDNIGARYVINRSFEDYNKIDNNIKKIYKELMPLKRIIGETDMILYLLNPSKIDVKIASNVNLETETGKDIYYEFIHPLEEILLEYDDKAEILYTKKLNIDVLDDLLFMNRKLSSYIWDTTITV